MKSLATKLFAVIFIVILAAGCASSITAPQDLQTHKQVQKQDNQGPGDVTNGSEMRMNREKPKTDL